MLTIKLAQKGKTNKKMFRLIISEKGRDPYGDVLEILGSYNPHSKELAAKNDRILYWLSKGAQMTATVNNLLVDKKVIEGKKAVASKAGQPSAKRQAQIKAKSDKKASREATPAPVETPAPAETPVEAAPAEVAETPTA
jgi:small subunit ribosomal protein S16